MLDARSLSSLKEEVKAWHSSMEPSYVWTCRTCMLVDLPQKMYVWMFCEVRIVAPFVQRDDLVVSYLASAALLRRKLEDLTRMHEVCRCRSLSKTSF
jgi:Zn-finger protein